MIENKSAFSNSSLQSDKWLLDPSLYFDDFLSMFHLMCAGIGIPLNFGVAIIIVGSRRLRSHRTVTWLGVGFSNIFLLTFHGLEVLAVHWPKSVASQICSSIHDLIFPTLVLGSFLYLLERQLCLKFSSWYKSHATSYWYVVAGQIGSFVILLLAIKGRLLFGAEPFQWPWRLFEFKILMCCSLKSDFLLV